MNKILKSTKQSSIQTTMHLSYKTLLIKDKLILTTQIIR